MTSPKRQPTSELQDALSDLEDRLETPVVPGEMQSWCSQVQAAFARLRALYEGQVRASHEQQLSDIRQEDPGLDARVTQMAEEDAAILVELDRLGRQLDGLSSRVDPQAETADALEGDDLDMDERLGELVEKLLSLVIRIRTIEKSLQTWFIEAKERDRGVVD